MKSDIRQRLICPQATALTVADKNNGTNRAIFLNHQHLISPMKNKTTKLLNFIYPLAIVGFLLLVTTGCSNDDNGTNTPTNQVPSLTTTLVTGVTQDTASSGGNITSDGGSTVTTRGVCWSTNPSPTITNDTTINGAGIGSFTSSITGLTPNTTYYVRAYATNSNGTAYGAQQQFTTPHPIAYVSGNGVNKEIYVVNINAAGEPVGNPVRLTNNSVEDDYPSWSPDGTKITFASMSSGNWDIWVMNANGTGLTQLTTDPNEDNYPSWSPDGQWIVFSSRRAGNSRIHKIPSAATNESTAPTILGDYATSGNDYFPSWSSNNKIVFTSTRNGGNYNIYVMDTTGVTDTLKDNTDTPVSGAYPSWSPDGTKIVLQSVTGDINKMDYSGTSVISNLTPLTNTGNNEDPSWSPDGTKIAFVSNRDGDNTVYLMKSDGTTATPDNLTGLGNNESSPAWWR
jgi:Tol biopolymer transport system component